jgi:metal-responsive CopG/Arc/MetJ family transcriptional regulator
MKKKISITLSSALLAEVDRHISPTGSRSAFIEKVLQDHVRELKWLELQQRDLELINANVDYFNREMEDIMRYQADVFADEPIPK